jgi:hypothetical protein
MAIFRIIVSISAIRSVSQLGVLSKYSLNLLRLKPFSEQILNKILILIVFVQLWHSKIIVLSRFNGFQLLDDVRIHNWNIIYPSQFVVSKYSYNFSLGTITSINNDELSVFFKCIYWIAHVICIQITRFHIIQKQ